MLRGGAILSTPSEKKSKPVVIYACTMRPSPTDPTQAGLVRDARRQLDPVDDLITDAKWDSIRTIVKTPPLADLKVHR